jgi:DinB superfamily
MTAQEFQETLDFLAHTPLRVSTLVTGLDSEALRYRPAADAFSALEQVCHLRDIESEGYVVRLRRMLAEDNPLLQDIDGGKLAAERDYHKQDAAAALKAFADARSACVELLQKTGPAQQLRTGHFGNAADITVAQLAGMMRGHDAEHLAELDALRERLLHAQQTAAARIQ